jgi:hypothetical protein
MYDPYLNLNQCKIMLIQSSEFVGIVSGVVGAVSSLTVELRYDIEDALSISLSGEFKSLIRCKCSL